MNLYDTAALYAQNMSEPQREKFRAFYRAAFQGFDFKLVHDCSIGAGGTTLPLAELGYAVSGSDLSENLLAKAADNFSAQGYEIKLSLRDLRDAGDAIPDGCGCVLSTGNSLPHVDLDGVRAFVSTAASRLGPGGLLFVDMRNWDAIVAERPIFTARDPFVMNEREHVSLYQVWEWHDDGSVDFVFVTSTDRDGRHVKTSALKAPRYYPLRYADYAAALSDYGFEIVGRYDMDGLWPGAHGGAGGKTGRFDDDFQKIAWYAVLARKTG